MKCKKEAFAKVFTFTSASFPIIFLYYISIYVKSQYN